LSDRYVDGDAAVNLLERRWFAADAAAKAMQSECVVLKAVVQQAEADLALAQAQLATLEALRDGLGEEIAALDAGNRGVMSAA
jgi:multidrug resistance efflux pump